MPKDPGSVQIRTLCSLLSRLLVVRLYRSPQDATNEPSNAPKTTDKTTNRLHVDRVSLLHVPGVVNEEILGLVLERIRFHLLEADLLVVDDLELRELLPTMREMNLLKPLTDLVHIVFTREVKGTVSSTSCSISHDPK
jgi:hypothetical protein